MAIIIASKATVRGSSPLEHANGSKIRGPQGSLFFVIQFDTLNPTCNF